MGKNSLLLPFFNFTPTCKSELLFTHVEGQPLSGIQSTWMAKRRLLQIKTFSINGLTKCILACVLTKAEAANCIGNACITLKLCLNWWVFFIKLCRRQLCQTSSGENTIIVCNSHDVKVFAFQVHGSYANMTNYPLKLIIYFLPGGRHIYLWNPLLWECQISSATTSTWQGRHGTKPRWLWKQPRRDATIKKNEVKKEEKSPPNFFVKASVSYHGCGRWVGNRQSCYGGPVFIIHVSLLLLWPIPADRPQLNRHQHLFLLQAAACNLSSLLLIYHLMSTTLSCVFHRLYQDINQRLYIMTAPKTKP